MKGPTQTVLLLGVLLAVAVSLVVVVGGLGSGDRSRRLGDALREDGTGGVGSPKLPPQEARSPNLARRPPPRVVSVPSASEPKEAEGPPQPLDSIVVPAVAWDGVPRREVFEELARKAHRSLWIDPAAKEAMRRLPVSMSLMETKLVDLLDRLTKRHDLGWQERAGTIEIFVVKH